MTSMVGLLVTVSCKERGLVSVLVVVGQEFAFVCLCGYDEERSE